MIQTKIQTLINHITLVVDRSGSMRGQPVERVFDTELARLKQRSIDLNQETRVSIYLFGSAIECLVFDMDVMRFPSLHGFYSPEGQTALIDGVLKAVIDNRDLPEKYGDHAFLIYVITDGQENASRGSARTLQQAIAELPDNWTVACLVPDPMGASEAKKLGIPKDSIAQWDTTAWDSFEKVGEQFSVVVDNYMRMRASGTRGTKSLFTVDTSNVTPTSLTPLKRGTYYVWRVPTEESIREFVERRTSRTYRAGSAYYQLTRTVKIQDYKYLLVQDTTTGKMYEGQHLRELLGLPGFTTSVRPADGGGRWNIFVQSTSFNRKLLPGTSVVVREGIY